MALSCVVGGSAPRHPRNGSTKRGAKFMTGDDDDDKDFFL